MNRKTVGVILFIIMALAVRLTERSLSNKSKNNPTPTRSGRVEGQVRETHHQSRSQTGDTASRTVPDVQNQWSDTHPRINLTHLFHGEINKKGKPVGFHSRPEGQDPADAGVISIKDNPNLAGIYTAQAWIREQDQTKFSSFFPDRLSWQEVINAVLYAYKNRDSNTGLKWRGPSGLGFTIEGWLLDNGDINTAYPIFKNK